MAVLLGVFVAAAFGTGDYLGGRASSRASVAGTLAVAQACALVGALVLTVVTRGSASASDLGLGALAGTAQVIGLALLYAGLARHTAGVVAPIAAVVATLIPVVWALVIGERPSVVVLAGVGLAMAAGVLLSRETSTDSAGGWADGAAIAVGAGLVFGVVIVLLDETARDSGMWPVLGARTAAATLVWGSVAVLVARRRPPVFPAGRDRWFALSAGVFDVSGTAAMLLAVRRGLLVVVAPIAALAPGFTVLLAWWYEGERLHTAQHVGIACALAGVLLVALG